MGSNPKQDDCQWLGKVLAAVWRQVHEISPKRSRSASKPPARIARKWPVWQLSQVPTYFDWEWPPSQVSNSTIASATAWHGRRRPVLACLISRRRTVTYSLEFDTNWLQWRRAYLLCRGTGRWKEAENCLFLKRSRSYGDYQRPRRILRAKHDSVEDCQSSYRLSLSAAYLYWKDFISQSGWKNRVNLFD